MVLDGRWVTQSGPVDRMPSLFCLSGFEMSTAASLPVDALAALVDAETQRQAARMAQDIFASIFRQAFSADQEAFGKAMSDVEFQCVQWCLAGAGADAQAVRLALLVSGLDQWGLAYSQAFDLSAIPALSALLGALRNRLDAPGEARFQWFFGQIDRVEGDAIDFKVELRRAIHLALWHAMTACETLEQAQGILQPLGAMMLALNEKMPELGWRLLADALANIQVGLLNGGEAASEVAQQSTQQLFESLRQVLPKERYQAILAHSGQVVLAWQQARRVNAGQA
jgi:hypothetical protein